MLTGPLRCKLQVSAHMSTELQVSTHRSTKLQVSAHRSTERQAAGQCPQSGKLQVSAHRSIELQASLCGRYLDITWVVAMSEELYNFAGWSVF